MMTDTLVFFGRTFDCTYDDNMLLDEKGKPTSFAVTHLDISPEQNMRRDIVLFGGKTQPDDYTVRAEPMEADDKIVGWKSTLLIRNGRLVQVLDTTGGAAG